jgi:uncharacterized membrane protein HdeD (DUF308 family)
LAVGILAIIFPEGFVVTILVLFGIALLIIGILRLATAYSSHLGGSSRTANALIGVIAIVIGLIILFFPTFAVVTFAVLIGIGLLIYGIGRVLVGGASNLSGGVRAANAVLGIIVAILGLVIIFVPAVGVFTYAFFVAIALILIGIDSLVSAALGVTLA